MPISVKKAKTSAAFAFEWGVFEVTQVSVSLRLASGGWRQCRDRSRCAPTFEPCRQRLPVARSCADRHRFRQGPTVPSLSWDGALRRRFQGRRRPNVTTASKGQKFSAVHGMLPLVRYRTIKVRYRTSGGVLLNPSFGLDFISDIKGMTWVALFGQTQCQAGFGRIL